MAIIHTFKALCFLLMVIAFIAPFTSAAEFAGGTGEPNDPYQIATVEQLISIGSDPNLLSKHFVLVMIYLGWIVEEHPDFSEWEISIKN